MTNAIEPHPKAKDHIACPSCSASLNFHSEAHEGDVTCCLACGTINVYTTRQTLRIATVQDILSQSPKDFKTLKFFNQNTRKLREGIERARAKA